MGITVTASYGHLRHAVAVPAPEAVPKPNRPDEFWWIEWCEGMPLQPACISFEGDKPSKIQQLGDDSWGIPLDEVPHIRLVERVAPVGSARALEEQDQARVSAQKLHRRCQGNERYVALLQEKVQRLEDLVDRLARPQAAWSASARVLTN